MLRNLACPLFGSDRFRMHGISSHTLTCGMEPTGHAPTVMEAAADQTGSSVSGTWALASVQQAERQYAIPAAFSAYLKAAGIRPKAMLRKERKESAVPESRI